MVKLVVRGIGGPGEASEQSANGADKSAWRDRVLAARTALTPGQRVRDAAAITAVVATLGGPGVTVCAYVPVGTEPGTPAMLDILLAEGSLVLLPIAREPGPLQWARYTGSLVRAPYGLREPDGPHLDADAISAAAVILVPALAVDRRGARLGRGAGYYDRTLVRADPAATLAAVVGDDELVDRLPADPHDVPVRAAITPRAGLVILG